MVMSNNNIRKINRVGRSRSFSVVIPAEAMRSLGWREKSRFIGDFNERLRLHNSGQVISTRSSLPWQLFYKEEFESERDAIIRERQLKAWKSRKALERLKFSK